MAKFDVEQDMACRVEDPNRFYIMVDDKFDVRLTRTDEGLVVDIFPWDGAESVASTYAYESDVVGDEESEEEAVCR